ncbi:glyoxalase family protein [Trichophyton verrucosum HKI 0517]|uniref:Glyoxalase family protein n=1 Tax=Trichophyton verrucosum (strain HKI 0517) TaxID=663202 RepID=D4DFR4_TRIVH|nr:glyoxalase family protein [Trichophyton verrucosum HKI 0517]EFE39290.1 glyoxalase family protein [Trichophyton verrucosum HKI 0517]
MGFSHVGLTVPDDKFEETVSFYLAALAPLGFKEHLRPHPKVVGMGVYYPEFWISSNAVPSSSAGVDVPAGSKDVVFGSTHIAFSTGNRELVHAFYDAALKHGGKSNGGPGVRPQYTRFYYAAFVFDPAGNNIETVCLWPAWCHWKYWFGMGVFGRQKTDTGIYLTMEPTEKAVKQARSARQRREKEIKITEKSKENNIKEIHQRRKTYLTETV